jgi:hypothetical protein
VVFASRIITPPETLRSQAERRRSQRLQVVKPVEVAWHTEEGVYIRKPAQSDTLSAHGALLRMEGDFPVREMIAVRRTAETHWAMARVLRCDPPRPEGWRLVAVELMVPDGAFWGAVFWAGV